MEVKWPKIRLCDWLSLTQSQLCLVAALPVTYKRRSHWWSRKSLGFRKLTFTEHVYCARSFHTLLLLTLTKSCEIGIVTPILPCGDINSERLKSLLKGIQIINGRARIYPWSLFWLHHATYNLTPNCVFSFFLPLPKSQESNWSTSCLLIPSCIFLSQDLA